MLVKITFIQLHSKTGFIIFYDMICMISRYMAAITKVVFTLYSTSYLNVLKRKEKTDTIKLEKGFNLLEISNFTDGKETILLN